MQDDVQGKAAVIFPGQGSQEKGMGRDVAENDRTATELWKLAERHAGAPLREIFWDGDEQAMTETRYQQPALVTTSLSLWRKLPQAGRLAALAGHSVGEYTALAAAGVLGIEEAIELVCLRGRLMFEAGREQAGTMAALLKIDQDTVRSIVDEVAAETGQDICIANYNTPVQLVVSGAEQAVDQAMAKAREQKGRPVQLPVSGAFHSPIMDEPARELAQAMDSMEWRDGRFPIYFNATARPETSGIRIKELMQQQMVSPVKWSQIIKAMWQDGVRSWLEVGSKDVLTKMMRYNLAETDGNWQATSLGSLDSLERASMLTA